MTTTTPSHNEHGRLLFPNTPNPQTVTVSSRRFQTLLDLLTSDDKSDGPDQTSGWRSLIGCCNSATWRRDSPSPSQPLTNDDVDENSSGMSLAEAMEQEREFRVSTERVSLSKLLETEEEEGGEVGNNMVCCVCMVRKKGAALIPCGHTFCRICSKEVWVKRGSCPLCNRIIIDILNIF